MAAEPADVVGILAGYVRSALQQRVSAGPHDAQYLKCERQGGGSDGGEAADSQHSLLERLDDLPRQQPHQARVRTLELHSARVSPPCQAFLNALTCNASLLDPLLHEQLLSKASVASCALVDALPTRVPLRCLACRSGS